MAEKIINMIWSSALWDIGDTPPGTESETCLQRCLRPLQLYGDQAFELYYIYLYLCQTSKTSLFQSLFANF